MNLPTKTRWRAWGWLLLIVFFPAFFLPIDTYGGYEAAWQQSMNLGHFFAFAVLAGWCVSQCRQRQFRYVHALSIVVCLLIILLVELIQPWFGRSGSVSDVYYGLSGSVLIVVLDMLKLRFHGRVRALLSVMLVCVVGIGVAAGSLREWSAVAWRETQFPLLADFENRLERPLWFVTGRGTSRFSQGRLQVDTVTGSWSGVNYQAGNLDWSGYGHLRITLDNPGPAFVLHLRIDDSRLSPEYAERINRSLRVKPGMNVFDVDLHEAIAAVRSADFDARKIRRLHLFVDKYTPDTRFYLGELRLY